MVATFFAVSMPSTRYIKHFALECHIYRHIGILLAGFIHTGESLELE
jgi:hypothetical protein